MRINLISIYLCIRGILQILEAFMSYDQLKSALLGKDIGQVRTILSLPNISPILTFVQSPSLFTALFYACMLIEEQTIIEVLDIMIKKDADPYHRDQYQQNILYYLAKDGKAKVIEWLLQKCKYDLNQKDKFGQTPLYFAAKHNRLKVAQLLIREGLDINQIDNNRQTALFFACAQGHLQMCKFLINRGSNPFFVDNLRLTPQAWARKRGQKHIIQYINGLKKGQEGEKIREKQQNSSKLQKRKKKQVVREEYILVYTNEEGKITQLTAAQIQKFKKAAQQNAKLIQCMMNPDNLEHVDSKVEKKFIKIANKMLTFLFKHPDGQIFHQPVDTNEIKDYALVIAHPMDFSTIKTKLHFNCYGNEQEFKSDVYLVFDNCVQFNGNQSYLGKLAMGFKMEFNQMWRKEISPI